MSVTASSYRPQVVTGADVRQIINQAGGDEVAAAQTLRTLMQYSQLTGDAEAQALRFIRQYGSTSNNCGCDPQGPMSQARALNVVLDNFDLLDTAAGIGSRDGIIGRADLQAILEAPGASAELKAAARFLLDNFSSIDDAAGNLGREDGKISRQDVQAGIADAGMTDAGAIDLIQGNFARIDTAAHGGSPDGLVSRSDLEAVARDKNASPELRAAARYALEHPELFDRIDTAGYGGDQDGLISQDDLNVAREATDLDGPGAALTTLMFFSTIDDAAGNLGRNDGLLARCDLEAIVEGDDAPPDVKAAARYLLDHPELYDQIDTAAYGGKKDGLISTDDLMAWMGNHEVEVPMMPGAPSTSMDPGQASIDVLRGSFDLLDTAAYGGDADGLVSRDDLAAAIANPNTPAHVKEAARYALEHPEVFDMIDTAGFGGDKDGLISRDDLNVARELVAMNDVTASQVAQANFSALDTAAHGGKPDGLVSRSDLQAIVEDDKSSPQLKAAAQYLLAHPEAFDQIDTAAYGGRKDGLISQDDLRAYLRDRAPDPSAMPPQGGGVQGGSNSPSMQDPFGDEFQNEIEEVLTDPTLTVEDQVTLFLMLIAKRMDKQIEEQMNYINSLQQQQNKAGAPGGAHGANGANGQPGQPGAQGQDGTPLAGADGSQSSIDVETMRLKRLIDKRSQLFDTLRQIIDKYNMTAKGIIDSMNR